MRSSDQLAKNVDELQYERRQGPCLQALDTGQLVRVPDLAAEGRWDGYPRHAVEHGVLSSLSVPVTARDTSVGALNLYAKTADVFSAPEVEARAIDLGNQASAVLTVLLDQARQAQLTDQLREALTSRSVIDQAIGIVMAQQRCTSAEAFALLRQASQRANRKLHALATEMVGSTGGEPARSSPFIQG